MPSNDKTGGPAFGQVVELRCVHVDPFGATDWEPEAMLHGGLTVLDYFATKALQGSMAAGGGGSPDEHAKWAYEVGAAMVRAKQAAASTTEASEVRDE